MSIQIGSFGEIVFEWPNAPAELEHESRTAYAEHAVAGGPSRIERAGSPAQTVRYRVRLRRLFGEMVLDIEAERERLIEMKDSGEAYPLFFGQVLLGEYVIRGVRTRRDGFEAMDVDLDLLHYT